MGLDWLLWATERPLIVKVAETGAEAAPAGPPVRATTARDNTATANSGRHSRLSLTPPVLMASS